MNQNKCKGDIIDFLLDNVNCSIVLVGVFALFSGFVGIKKNWIAGLPDVLTIINFILFSYYLLVGIFLMRFKNWARISAMAYSTLYFVLAIGAIIVMGAKETSLLDQKAFLDKFGSLYNLKFVFNAIAHAAVLIILTGAKVKEKFK